tara:strand:- start:685 stop:1374 length:690 start_codon:yes stop_codon:yes gene_type:complete
MSQLALPLQLDDYAVFSSFLSKGNELIVATLSEIAVDQESYGCWIWGAEATGKSHLLQAVCETAGDQSVYIPLRSFIGLGPKILEDLASRELICIDDLNLIAGHSGWEAALFNLCNQIFSVNGKLIVSADSSPRECSMSLADLQSRMMRLPVFQLVSLDESARICALQLRSRHRGIELPNSTAKYLLKRSRRDMASLYKILDLLDREGLRAKRRLTVPFAREVLNSIKD